MSAELSQDDLSADMLQEDLDVPTGDNIQHADSFGCTVRRQASIEHG